VFKTWSRARLHRPRRLLHLRCGPSVLHGPGPGLAWRSLRRLLLRRLLVLRLLELRLLMLLRWLLLLLLRLLVLRPLELRLLMLLLWRLLALLLLALRPRATTIVIVGRYPAGAKPKQQDQAGQPHCNAISKRSSAHGR